MKVLDVEVHPLNQEIYGNGSVEDLKSSMDKFGLDNPIVVNQNNVLLSGHRRLQAARELGWETIKHQVREFEDPNDEIEFLIRSNTYRQKTHEMIAKEAEAMREIERKKAEIRKLQNLTSYSKIKDPEIREAAKGRTEQIIADKLGTNIGLVRNSFKFSDLTKDMKNDELDFYKKMFNHNVSGSLEAIELNLYKNLKSDQKENLLKSPNQLRRIVKNTKLDKYKSRFGVVYADPCWHEKTVEDLTDEKKYPIQAITKKGAKLFLVVSPDYIPQALEIISKWGFKYYTNCIWTFKENSNTKHKMLFLAHKAKDVKFNSFEGSSGITNSEKMPFMEAIKKEDKDAVRLNINKKDISGFETLSEVLDDLIKTSFDKEVETVDGSDLMN
ncbi:ParB/RepB/Spo0J family partition protein [Bacteroidota bacterium]